MYNRMTGRLNWRRNPFRLMSVTAFVATLALILGACGEGTGDADDTVSSIASAEGVENTLPESETSDPDGADEDPSVQAATDFDDLVTQAQSEGALTLYCSLSEDTARPVLEAFESKYGIATNYFREVQGPLIQRFETERAAGVHDADVICHGDPMHLQELDAEALLSNISGLPSVQEMPEQFVRAGGSYLSYNISPFALLYNTDAFADGAEPETWHDLVAGDFEARLAIVDINLSDDFINLWSGFVENADYGETFLEGIAAKNPAVVASATPGMQSVAAGEYDVLVNGLWDPMVALRREGAPVDGVVPSFSGGTERLAAALNNGRSPSAAMLFMDFLASREAQELIAGDPFNTVSPLEGIPGAAQLADEFFFYDRDRLEKHRDTIVRILG